MQLWVSVIVRRSRTYAGTHQTTPTSVANPGFPIGGGTDPLGGADLQRVHFLAKTYAKMKEIDPVGGEGVHASSTPLVPPMHLAPYPHLHHPPICTSTALCHLPPSPHTHIPLTLAPTPTCGIVNPSAHAPTMSWWYTTLTHTCTHTTRGIVKPSAHAPTMSWWYTTLTPHLSHTHTHTHLWYSEAQYRHPNYVLVVHHPHTHPHPSHTHTHTHLWFSEAQCTCPHNVLGHHHPPQCSDDTHHTQPPTYPLPPDTRDTPAPTCGIAKPSAHAPTMSW